MSRYLYGANAKRIQSYIFNSSKLQEIAGASELVQHVCSGFFEDFCQRHGIEKEVIIGAAGNIRAVVLTEESARKLMLHFPKEVMRLAPGLELVQGVVEIEGELPGMAEAEELTRQLREALPSASPYKDWSVTLKAPLSGRPASEVKDGLLMDPESAAKREHVKPHWKSLCRIFSEREFPADAEKIAAPDSYLAVIHSDGNSIGQALMRLASGAGESYGAKWREFSLKLDEVTRAAAVRAYEAHFAGEGKIRFRPIILGGDDLTVVCSAEHALEFTHDYLKFFEEEAAEREATLGRLSACAGVAFVKASYPFHYGVHLAEMLCGQAKKIAKKGLAEGAMVPSCLMFARELGGFVDATFEELAERELQTGEVSQVFGPYATQDGTGLPALDSLLGCARCLQGEGGSPLESGLRRVIHELHVSQEAANLLMDRLEQVAKEQKCLASLKRGLAQLGDCSADRPLKDLCVLGRDRKCSPLMDLLLAAKFADNGKNN
ncbi:MAG: hypothetical protein IJJ33_02715 [Victivallales bacterium]|nr:hypothetical protein [Victivallales bacterium]